MPLSPHSPRRQRRAVYEADTFERRRRMSVPLSRELRARFHRRSVAIRKGDTVRVMNGSYVGREERVARVDRRGYTVTLDNVTLKTGEEKLKPLPIRTNHLLLVRLNLADAWRRESMQVRAEELTPEERGEAPEVADEVPASPTNATAPPPPVPSVDDPDRADDDDDADEEEPSSAVPPSAAPSRGPKASAPKKKTGRSESA